MCRPTTIFLFERIVFERNCYARNTDSEKTDFAIMRSSQSNYNTQCSTMHTFDEIGGKIIANLFYVCNSFANVSAFQNI